MTLARLIPAAVSGSPLGCNGEDWGYWSVDWRSRAQWIAERAAASIGNGPAVELLNDSMWGFRLRGKGQRLGPWLMLVHPLWSTPGAPDSIVGQAELQLREMADGAPVTLVDTFNISRRPNRVREWILDDMDQN